MLLTEGDRTVMIAALQFCAIYWGREAETHQKAGRPVDATKAAAFSSECVRLARAVQTGR